MPGVVLLPYVNTAVGVNAVNTALTAATDQDFTQDGSGNYRFSEDYQLLACGLIGASVTKGRFQVPHWNALTEFDIFAANRNAGPPSNPYLDWYTQMRLPIPKFESFQVQVSGNLGSATENDSFFMLLAAADGLWPMPTAGMPIRTTFTFTQTPTVGAWGAPNVITFTQSLRGGVYAVLGLILQGANADYYRIIFPRYRMYNGRKLRPGFLLQAAVGNVPSLQLQYGQGQLSELGRFWTQEPFQIELFGRTASSTTYTGFLDLLYLGEDQSLAYQGSGGGGAGGYSTTAAIATS